LVGDLKVGIILPISETALNIADFRIVFIFSYIFWSSYNILLSFFTYLRKKSLSFLILYINNNVNLNIDRSTYAYLIHLTSLTQGLKKKLVHCLDKKYL